mmetsp:Transcript_12877/g.28598  ORF Transcript_12877/g.28598 Transcript_12877/m.28598 type:complete len:232 (+) Transcript_12877:1926-2621(+)
MLARLSACLHCRADDDLVGQHSSGRHVVQVEQCLFEALGSRKPVHEAAVRVHIGLQVRMLGQSLEDALALLHSLGVARAPQYVVVAHQVRGVSQARHLRENFHRLSDAPQASGGDDSVIDVRQGGVAVAVHFCAPVLTPLYPRCCISLLAAFPAIPTAHAIPPVPAVNSTVCRVPTVPEQQQHTIQVACPLSAGSGVFGRAGPALVLAVQLGSEIARPRPRHGCRWLPLPR